jgi:hypothetical protein
MRRLTKFLAALTLGAILASSIAAPSSAHGWGGGGGGWHGGGGGWHGGWGGGWHGGWGIGIGIAPLYAPSPYYYPPPVYYAPPPAYYPPPPSGYYSPYPGFIERSPAPAAQPSPVESNATTAQSCNAGNYTCPMEVNVPVGGRCYCPGNDGNREYGSAQ